MSRRFTWTALQLQRLDDVLEVLEELQKYKPLTLRQIYYRLVGKGIIENKMSRYNMLSDLLKWARLDGYIDWEDIEDRVRVVHSGIGWDDECEFFDNQVARFLKGYRRHLVQDQAVYVEVWIEKDALCRMFSTITRKYCISTVVCRGFSSVSFLYEYTQRVNYYLEMGQEPVMLYFGDFDPSGEEMVEAMGITLRDEMGVEDLRIHKVALTPQDIFDHDLPHDPKALKRKDSRAAKHRARYGELAVELDALHPDVLETKIRDAIEAQFDMHLFNEQYDLQVEESDTLENTRVQLARTAQELWDER